jgi:hypothetical protein
MTEEQTKALRKRILLPWQVQRGTTAWAPWGKSGWSAVIVRTTQRKWAKGVRVKPHNETETAKGKIPMERLLRRDPKLKGKDRPGCTPDEAFAFLEEEKAAKKPKTPSPAVEKTDGTVEWASARDIGTHRETAEQKQARLNPPARQELTKEERQERAQRLLDLFDDDSTDDDW